MKTICIRCKKEFEQANHPMAHFFTICHECRKESPETISDQTNYNLMQYNNLCPDGTQHWI